MRRILVLPLLVLLIGCANRVSPGGGPKDEKGPEVLTVVPEAGATGIRDDVEISISFDERIKAEEDDVFVSPGFPDFDVKIKGHSIELMPLDTLLSNTTYIVNISADVEDLRNNRLDGGYQLAFSTGDILDTLSIGGRIFDEDLEPAARARCCLWRLPMDSLRPPDYIGWPDSSGVYKVGNLGEGSYIVGAFSRLDNGYLPALDRPYGIATHIANIPAVESFDLFMTERDTSALTVKMVNQRGMFMVELTLSGEVKVTSLTENDDGFEIYPKGEFAGKLSLLSDERMKKGNYLMEITGLTDIYGNETGIDSIAYEIRMQTDTLPPYTSKRLPNEKGKMEYGNDVELFFAVPVDFCEVDFRVINNDTAGISDTLVLDVRTELLSPFRAVARPQWPDISEYDKGEYRISKLTGRNGVSMSDSGWTSFRLIDAAEGGSVILPDLPFVCRSPIVRLKNKAETFPLMPTDSGYVALGIPSGNYSLFIFCDADGDSLLDGGGIFPLRFGEAAFVHPDSIGVRDKWVTEIGE